MMKPILVIGHPQSGYGRVEALLNACGMQQPLPSRREGFSPIEISEILRKAYLASDATAQVPEIQQIEPGSIWHGMALDLMLGNLDQALWGWADPKSIHLLDYWKSLDPKITFILVYNEPQTVLTGRGEDDGHLTEQALEAEMKQWCAFNVALLNFYYRNPGRCLLVHAQQVGLSANRYLQQVQARIEIPLASPEPLTGQAGVDNQAEAGLPATAPEDTGVPDQDYASASFGQEIQAWGSADMEPDSDPLSQYLAGDLLGFFPEARQLYDELQSVANLPLARDPNAKQSPLAAWKLMADLRQQLKQHEASNRAYQEELHALSEQNAQAEQQLSTLDLEMRALGESKTELQQENELLLLQLHQVQEELEQHYLTAQDRLQKLGQVETQKQAAEAQAKNLEQQMAQTAAAKTTAEKEIVEIKKKQAQLAQQLDAQTALAAERARQLEVAQQAVVENASSELKEENELLLLQLHQVQEELERYYLENQKLKQNPDADGNSQQATAETAQQPLTQQPRYGAAERVKQQLSYRLGAAMIANHKSLAGWVKMPFALSREVRAFNRECKEQGEQTLPPIDSYYDAHEAERVKQHLSYRLGAAMLAHRKSPIGWIKMPWVLAGEVKDFKRWRAGKE